ncbi:MAG: GNAT family N-acetyltransferase [Thermodesulfobacteriota bacterium]
MTPSHPLTLRTERLRLVAGDARLVRAALADRLALGELLDAGIPQSWPPPQVADAEPVWAERLAADPALAGWLHWFVVLLDEEGEEDMLIGSAGFNGLDYETGTLLLGFAVLPAFAGLGYATEAAWALLEWAFERPGVRRVAARAFPDNPASLRVLDKLGMRRVDDPADPCFEATDSRAGALLFAVTPDDLEAE